MGVPLRVLIIEDSEDDCALLLRELRRGGYMPEYARVDTGEALGEALDRQAWDVIFSDYTMPSFSGTQALALVRERGIDAPFIFVSGTLGEDTAVASMKAGAHDYIMKNNTKRLLPAVARELREAKVRREHQRAETERREAEARFRNVLEIAAEGIISVDESQQILIFNRGAEQIFGYQAEEVLGKPLDVLLPERYVDVHREHVRHFASGPEPAKSMNCRATIRGRRKDGSEFPAEASISKLTQGGQTLFTVILHDISARKQAEERIYYLAHHDVLTGLPNRTLLQDRLQQAIIDANRHDHLVAVLLLDMDRFKIINDTLGHDMGDQLLRKVSERLATGLREGDTVARIGGDEFVIVLQDTVYMEDAGRVARKILDQFTQPFHLAGRELFTSCSLGIAVYPMDGADIDNLLKKADMAMYQAKEHGGSNYRFYSEEINAYSLERLALETDLRHALERQEFMLHYQPQVDLATGEIVGAEALLRWRHPDKGTVPPSEFIGLAEDTGLIMPLGEWTLSAACAQYKRWLDTYSIRWRVAVNLSARQFLQPHLEQKLRQVWEQAGLEPSCIELEITESALMQDIETSIATMERLVALGVAFSIDDFGTGYSSLSYLKRFPVDTLKIDASFIRGVPDNSHDAAIAGTIIALAHNLGVRAVAEGVSTAEQVKFLRLCRCDAVQGYYFSPPRPASEFTDLLSKKTS